MTINDRIREVRKALGLTQVEFGERVGIVQGHLTSIENGKKNVTEKTVKVICATFSVSERWLRTGIGEMFVESERTIISQLSDEYNLDILDRKIIECYLNLGPVQRRAVKEYVRSLVDAVVSSEEDYSEYREDYISEKAMPFAARGGNGANLKEAQNEYDNANDGEEDV